MNGYFGNIEGVSIFTNGGFRNDKKFEKLIKDYGRLFIDGSIDNLSFTYKDEVVEMKRDI